jgi:hypothetical protein
MRRMSTHPVVAAALLLLSVRLVSYGDGTIEVLTPTLGQEYRIGDTLTVSWTFHAEQGPEGGGVAVLVSPTEGRDWVRIVGELIANDDPVYYHDGIGTYRWVIVDSLRLYLDVYLQLASETCRVMVGAPYDESFATGESELFAIRSSAATNAAALRPPLSDSRLADAAGGLVAFGLDGRRVILEDASVRHRPSGTASGLRIVRPGAVGTAHCGMLLVDRR